MNHFSTISPKDLTDNAIRLIGFDWMLITGGTPEKVNTMTASWGGLGYLWNKPVAFIFIRPQRFTLKFVESNDFFTLQFFEKKYRDILNYCGKFSGRDVDKISETGLSPFKSPNGGVYFNESRLQMECKKLYADDFKEEHFIDSSMLRNYPDRDFHRFFVGEITDCISAG